MAQTVGLENRLKLAAPAGVAQVVALDITILAILYREGETPPGLSHTVKGTITMKKQPRQQNSLLHRGSGNLPSV
jgi:hypothetical protein